MSASPDHAGPRELFRGASFWITAVILTMPVRQVALASFGGANLRVGDIVLAIAVMLWWGAVLTRRRPGLRWTGLDRAILLFVLACAVSLFWSQQSAHGYVRVFKLVRNLALYSMLVAYLRHDFASGFRRLALALVTAGLLQSLAFVYSIGQFGGTEALAALVDAESLLSNDSRLSVVKTENGGGIFLRGAASWLGLCLFFGLGIVHRVRSRVGARVVWLSIGAMTMLTVLTLSRSAWIALATGAIATLAGLRPSKTVKFGVAAVMIGAIAWLIGASSMFTNIFASRLGGDALANDPSLNDRWDYIALALRSFERSPLLGGGAAGIDPTEYVTVHNVYMQVLGELGLLGVVLFGAILILWPRSLFAAWRRSRALRDEGLRKTVAAMAGITIFFLTYFFAGHDLESSEPWIVMAVCSAMFAVTRRPAPVRRRQAPSVAVASPRPMGAR